MTERILAALLCERKLFMCPFTKVPLGADPWAPAQGKATGTG